MKTIKQLKPKLAFIGKAYRPILANVKVESDCIICTDLETFIKIKNNYNMTPGVQSYKTLGLIESDQESVDDYPLIDFEIDPVFSVMTNRKVLEDLNRYASDDETRAMLNGITIDGNYLVATNGHILKSVEISTVNLDTPNKNAYIIPRTGIQKLITLLKGFKVDTLTIQCNEDFAVIDNEHFTLKMRLVHRDYVKWNNITPKKFNKSFKVDKWINFKELKPLFDEQMKCKLKNVDGNIVLIPRDYPDQHIIIGKSNLEFEIGFNVEYLNMAANGCKSFEVKFNSPLAPILVNGAIVMPLIL